MYHMPSARESVQTDYRPAHSPTLPTALRTSQACLAVRPVEAAVMKTAACYMQLEVVALRLCGRQMT